MTDLATVQRRVLALTLALARARLEERRIRERMNQKKVNE